MFQACFGIENAFMWFWAPFGRWLACYVITSHTTSHKFAKCKHRCCRVQNWVLWVLSCCSLIARAREIRPSGSKLRPFYQSVRKLSVDYRLIEKYCIASTVLNFGKASTLPSYKIFSTIFWRLETIVLIHFYENCQIKRNSSMYSNRRHLYFNKIKLSMFFLSFNC